MRVPALLLLQATVAAATASTHVMQLLFNFTEVRHPWSQELQISELRLFSATGQRIASVNTTSLNGQAPQRTQMAVQASDGSVQTKWVDIGFRNNGFSLLYITPESSEPVAQCELQPLEHT